MRCFATALMVPVALGWLAASTAAQTVLAEQRFPTLAPLLEKALPAVVSIRVIGQRVQPSELKPGQPTPAPPRMQPFKAGGSGIIFDAENGLIGTNHHVVKDAVAISVGLHDGRSVPAKLLGIDIGTDIAILKIDLTNLKMLPLGNSNSVKIGDFVVAIGNPYGLEGTATAGIVSGLMRSDVGYEIFESFIQTDAAVNPGNSGGALINLQGELIGINTAIAGRGSNIGIGFAIPINMARKVGREILLHGRVQRGAVGLLTEDVQPAAAQALRRTRGAQINHVQPLSPAAQEGLAPGQVIISVNEGPIRNNSEYMAYFGSAAIGDTLLLEIASHESTRKVKLTVVSMKVEPPTVVVPASTPGIGGLVVASIVPGSPLYGELRGAVVHQIEAQSAADKAGFKRDDVIVAVGQDNIVDIEQISRLAEAGTGIERMTIIRSGVPYYLRFQP